jgi:hypothetical protein
MKHRSALSSLVVLAVALALYPCSSSADEPGATVEAGAPVPANGIVVFYFHGNVRCSTCRTLEAYAEEAVSRGFADELATGRLAWRVVNVDQPENRHFVRDFELVTKSVVLVEYRDGQVTRYENLKLVWQLVRDKDGFLTYVRDATREFLGST